MTTKEEDWTRAQYLAATQGGVPEDYLPGTEHKGNGGGGSIYASGEKRGGKVIAEYIYLDEEKKPYLRVERTLEKQFPQSHWDGKRWRPGRPKGPKIPYNLPDLIEAGPDVPIFLCEGEKDADNLTDFGVLATCASEGAGKWSAELNKWFDGKSTVYIMQDNDIAGRQHAQKVAQNLIGIVDDLRIVALPDLPEKGDVSDWLAAGGTKEQLFKLAAAAPAAAGWAKIAVVAGQIARAIDETQNALINTNQPVLVRAGVLVQPLFDRYPTSNGKKVQVSILRRISVPNLTYIVNKHAAQYYRYDAAKKKNVTVDPPTNIITGLIDLGHWNFPRVTGVMCTPTMKPNGEILTASGYDEMTGLWHWPERNLNLPEIEEKPSVATAMAALELLSGLLDEFPFISELDKSVALAGMITAVVRGAFTLAPMFLFNAPAAGTGKSYLVDVISHIATGRWCPVIDVKAPGEEVDKRLGSLLLESPPLISLDNIVGDLRGGPTLCHMVERPVVKVRILGKSEMPECEWRGTVFATGNNTRLVGDLTRRGLICNVDAKTEDPSTRNFSRNPIDEVMSNRGNFIAAALTLVRAYLTNGEKVNCSQIGSYNGWSRFVREPLIWLGRPDPMESMKQAKEEDPERESAQALIDCWIKHIGTEQRIKISEIIDLASEQVPGASFDIIRARPDFFNLLIERTRAKGGKNIIDARYFGFWLRTIKGQVFHGYRIVLAKKDDSNGSYWKLEQIENAQGV